MATAYLTLTVQDEAGAPQARKTWTAKGCENSRRSCCGFSASTFSLEVGRGFNS
jgi:hypothetical protein